MAFACMAQSNFYSLMLLLFFSCWPTLMQSCSDSPVSTLPLSMLQASADALFVPASISRLPYGYIIILKVFVLYELFTH